MNMMANNHTNTTEAEAEVEASTAGNEKSGANYCNSSFFSCSQ